MRNDLNTAAALVLAVLAGLVGWAVFIAAGVGIYAALIALIGAIA